MITQLPCWSPRISSFFVSCSSIWITTVKFGVGKVLGECEPGQVRLESEEMLPRMGEIQSSQCWIQVTRKCSLEILIPPSHLFPFTGTYGWNKNGGQIKRIQKSRAWKILFPLDEIKILNLRGRRNVGSLWGGNPGGGGRMRRSCRVWISEQLSSCPCPRLQGHSGTPRAGGAALAPGRQINLLSSSFCPKLDEWSDTLLSALN